MAMYWKAEILKHEELHEIDFSKRATEGEALADAQAYLDARGEADQFGLEGQAAEWSENSFGDGIDTNTGRVAVLNGRSRPGTLFDDWAQEIIVAMNRGPFCDYEAGHAFRRCYRGGDTLEACEAFTALAKRIVDASNEGYEGTCECLVFADGSCYCTWKEGLDRFYPEASILADEERETDPDLAARIDAAYAECQKVL